MYSKMSSKTTKNAKRDLKRLFYMLFGPLRECETTFCKLKKVVVAA